MKLSPKTTIIAPEKLRDYVLNLSHPMTFSLFSRVILTQDIPEENLLAGDTGTIVEYHPATDDYPEGYEVEFFAGNGETLAVVSVPATALRAATRKDVLHARQLIAA